LEAESETREAGEKRDGFLLWYGKVGVKKTCTGGLARLITVN
jgi:hypothetical protein